MKSRVRSWFKIDEDERPAMPETEELAIAPAVQAIMGRLAADASVAYEVLRKEWPQFIGHDNATRSRPLSLVDGTLNVGVKGSVWFQQIKRMGTAALLSRIEKRLGPGTIKKITFVPM